MNLAVNLKNQQTQSLAVTAKVIQSINILQFDQFELTHFVSEQAEKNPLIEFAAPLDEAVTSGNAETETNKWNPAVDKATDERRRADTSGNAGSNDRDTGYQYGPGGGSAISQDLPNLENYVAARVTLQDHLQSQLGPGFREAVERAIAAEIIGSLDDDGYLRRDTTLIADAMETSEALVLSVLGKIQKMDPAGVAARNLPECLRLQLSDAGRLSQEMEILLDNLALLAGYELQRLAALCDVSVSEVSAMADEIRELDPRPGCRFDCEPVIPALPDVIVKRRPDGTFVTELNQRVLPRILVNRQYYSEIETGCSEANVVKFVADCVTEANWLARSLDQRAQTILKVATEIVSRQHEFLRDGVEHLKPLNLKDVADAIGVHPSTVCRAVSSKYVMTDRGLYELSYFFATSISASDGGEDYAADTVRHHIRRLIAKETTPETVLSDDAIVKALREDGIDIARRTVAKYREGMNIPSSLLRKRQRRNLVNGKASVATSKTKRVTLAGGSASNSSPELISA